MARRRIRATLRCEGSFNVVNVVLAQVMHESVPDECKQRSLISEMSLCAFRDLPEDLNAGTSRWFSKTAFEPGPRASEEPSYDLWLQVAFPEPSKAPRCGEDRRRSPVESNKPHSLELGTTKPLGHRGSSDFKSIKVLHRLHTTLSG